MPFDVLLIINQLNNPTVISGLGMLVDPASLATFPMRFFDTDGNGFCTPLDALSIINSLNTLAPEGELIPEMAHGDESLSLLESGLIWLNAAAGVELEVQGDVGQRTYKQTGSGSETSPDVDATERARSGENAFGRLDDGRSSSPRYCTVGAVGSVVGPRSSPGVARAADRRAGAGSGFPLPARVKPETQVLMLRTLLVFTPKALHNIAQGK